MCSANIDVMRHKPRHVEKRRICGADNTPFWRSATQTRNGESYAAVWFRSCVFFGPTQLACAQSAQAAEHSTRVVDQPLEHVMGQRFDHWIARSFIPKASDHVYIKPAICQ